ncbi:hypothetical protein HII17_00770 [Thalassotalea sp. M1531]|uniref:Uncharacterized protein n=1 Tax=Thalassotalea algicola TaxID=2716224 RepID=A0A7Y0Q4L1_9GAMM|nr:hypothetical protein [Thalassotalea algicola]NMP30079.1 hypothetical protein [Thalassotalea algicola]
MNKSLTVLLILTLQACVSTEQQAEIDNHTNIVVLKYYPECEYKILGTVTGRSGASEADHNYNENMLFKRTTSFRNAKGTPELAVKQAKERAAKLGADAVAIIDYRATQQRLKLGKGRAVNAEKHTMRVQAIKLCDDATVKINAKNDKPVKYNEHGQRNHGKVFTSTVSFNMHKVDKKKDAQSKGLISENIDINGDVLGMPLGISKKALINQLGVPSAIITVKTHQQALLYGRKHLFFVNQDIVVGYEHTSWFLPPHISNRVSYHDDFDEADITIANELAMENSLQQVVEKLKLIAPKLRGNAITIQNQSHITLLTFIRKRDLYDNVNNYQLNGISVYQRGFQPFNWHKLLAEQPIVPYLDLNKSLLDNKSVIDKSDVIAKLGMPTATIKKSALKDTWVYGEELIIDFLRDGLVKFTLETTNSKYTRQNCTQCLYLGQLKREIPVQYVTTHGQRKMTLESNGFSYLVAFSEGKSPKIDDIKVFLTP